jgi:hypothetical protein
MRRSSKLFPLLLAVFALAFAPACGSTVDDDDTPDAANGDTPDAMTSTPDAMGGAMLTGLGQLCSQSMPCSDAEVPLCIPSPQGSQSGYCTLECASGRTVMTDAQGNITLQAIPDEDHAKCANAYGGEQGVGLCALITSFDPPVSGAPAPNTEYSIDAVCAILCDQQGMCPSGYTCNAGYCEVG